MGFEVGFALLAELFVVLLAFCAGSVTALGGVDWDWEMYLSPEPQFLFFFAFGSFLLCKFLARDFALVETCEIFFAGGRVEVDFLGGGNCYFAFLGWGRHGLGSIAAGCALPCCGGARCGREVLKMRSWKIVAGIWGSSGEWKL